MKRLKNREGSIVYSFNQNEQLKQVLTCEDGIWARRIVFAVALEKILNLEGLGLLAFICKAVSQDRSRALYRKRKLKYMLFRAIESFCNIRVCAISIPGSHLELLLLARLCEQNSVSQGTGIDLKMFKREEKRD